MPYRLHHYVVFGVLFLMAGCSVLQSFKKQRSSPAQTEHKTAPQPIQTTETVPEVAYAPTLEPVPEPEMAPLKAVEPESEPEPAVPTILFSEAECQHVRLSSGRHNPFPSTGEMCLDLDALQSSFCYPYPGKLISPYGPRGRSMHTGMDIKAIPSDTIRAAFDGVVRMAKPYSAYGNLVVIRHYNGTETVYSHNVRNLVSPNDVVKAGDAIALAGRTGRATTEHLHFEFRVGGEHLNPTLILDPENQSLRKGKLYVSNRSGKVRASSTPFVYTEEDNTPGSTATTTTTNTSTPKPTAAVSGTQGAVYHTIKQGDTLSALAKKYGTTVNKICALNNIKPTKILQLKEKIRVK